jgi:hypothetical protein
VVVPLHVQLPHDWAAGSTWWAVVLPRLPVLPVVSFMHAAVGREPQYKVSPLLQRSPTIAL